MGSRGFSPHARHYLNGHLKLGFAQRVMNESGDRSTRRLIGQKTWKFLRDDSATDATVTWHGRFKLETRYGKGPSRF